MFQQLQMLQSDTLMYNEVKPWLPAGGITVVMGNRICGFTAITGSVNAVMR